MVFFRGCSRLPRLSLSHAVPALVKVLQQCGQNKNDENYQNDTLDQIERALNEIKILSQSHAKELFRTDSVLRCFLLEGSSI
jgi:hypothetical protein